MLRPLVNVINRAPMDEHLSEATYEVHVVTTPDTVGEVRDLLDEVLEKASYPIRRGTVSKGERTQGDPRQHLGRSGGTRRRRDRTRKVAAGVLRDLVGRVWGTRVTLHAAPDNGLARSTRAFSAGEFIASHKSLRRCTFSQNSALFPNTRARINAVRAVTLRRSLQSS